MVEMLVRRNADICFVQETRFRGSGSRIFGESDQKYKLWWSGETTSKGGVGIFVKEKLVENVIKVERPRTDIMKL